MLLQSAKLTADSIRNDEIAGISRLPAKLAIKTLGTGSEGVCLPIVKSKNISKKNLQL
jgi:hypothetical protein